MDPVTHNVKVTMSIFAVIHIFGFIFQIEKQTL